MMAGSMMACSPVAATKRISTKAIIFDMDGLLLDSETISYQSYVATAKRHGLETDFDGYKALIGLNMAEAITILRQILPTDVDAADFKAEWVTAYQQRLSGPVPVKPGIATIISNLATQRVPMAVATSSQGAKARALLDRAGLAKHMISITGGNEVARGKPAPDVYLASISALACAGVRGADDCIAFEDSEVGVRAARAAGLRVIQVPDLMPAAKPASPPHHLIADDLETGVGWLQITPA